MLRHLPLDLEGDLTRALGPLIDFRNGQPMFANEYVRDYIHNELTAKLNSGGDYSCEVSTHADLTRSRPHIFGTLWGSSSGPTRKMPYFLGTERIGFQPLGAPGCTCLESLQAAVIRGHLQTIDVLLQLLPDVSSALEDNPSLYLDAIGSGKSEVLKRLLDVGRAQLPVEVGSNLLRLAAQAGHLAVIRELIRRIGEPAVGQCDGGRC
ncbi:ankyrin repeat domain-containing protein [Aspergillus luchuensis]|uniref:Ankyrin repeat-containing protein n=1 Tax=Aspergillus kawachii TaxID=1069201 RepID=A0A7R7W7K3_ASPKA|nr:uncharacterized protein AKAW2_31118S [Aspergillus luchuensis]BCR97799.1 hypothetical protein AKAW2_31118S [Aspergillus luchuensis]